MIIWIMNHHASGMRLAKGGRHYWFAKYLDRMGHRPVVFCCNSVHNSPVGRLYFETDDLFQVHMADEINTPFVYVKARKYTGNGTGRILAMFDFYHNVKIAGKKYAKEHGKPDVILASSVHPLTMVAGIQLAKYFKVKCICEVRDLWPEAIFAYSNKISRNGLVGKALCAGEKWIYTKADALIFTQEGGADYILDKKWDTNHGGPIDMNKVYHINNGVDLEAYDQNLKEYWLEDSDLDDPNTYKIIYCGRIRRINNLGIILDTAKLISNPKIKFIIFGDGDELEMLKQRVREEKIDNVIFKGAVKKSCIPSVNVRADVNLVHWEMSPLVAKVGESYNKAFEYFASGKPVFYTIRPKYSIVEKYHCGLLTEGFTPQDIANGIEKIATMSDEEKRIMAINARKVAEIYDFKNHTKKLIEIIEAIK